MTRAADMRARVRDFDWTATSIGPRDKWPESLKLMLSVILDFGFPMSVRWGPDLIVLYNDAYAPLLGDRHPRALGKPLRDVWPEIYAELGTLHEEILRGDRGSFFAEDHLWRIQRLGVPEDARFTVSYSPIADSSAPNGIGGILATAFETTERVRNEKTPPGAHAAARDGSRAADARARPDMGCLGRSPRRLQLRWIFPERQSGVDQLAWLD